MSNLQSLLVAVESATPGVRIVRTAGVLDRPAADRLLRLADAQIKLYTAGHRVLRHLVVDLANVTRFDPGGLEAFRIGWHERGDRGVQLHVAGCGGRVHLLPLGAGRLMRELSTFPTVEVAVAQLCTPAVDVPAPRPPSAAAAADTDGHSYGGSTQNSWPPGSVSSTGGRAGS